MHTKPSKSQTPSGNLPAWQAEYRRRRQRICAGIAARLQTGDTLTTCIRRRARLWNGKPFKCDPARAFRSTEKTIQRWFYIWRKNPDAVQLRYRSSTAPRVTPELLQAFVRICGEPHTRTCLGAFRQLKAEWPSPLPVTYSTLCRYLGRKTLNQLRAYHRAVAESEQALARAKAMAEKEVLLRLPQPPRSAAA